MLEITQRNSVRHQFKNMFIKQKFYLFNKLGERHAEETYIRFLAVKVSSLRKALSDSTTEP